MYFNLLNINLRNRNSKVIRKSFIEIEKNIAQDANNNSNAEDPSYEDLSETESSSLNDESRKLGDLSQLSKSEAWENNSDTPDITIEINDSTTTMEESSSVTEAEDDEQKANLTIQEFLDETETIANELVDEDPEEMFTNLITKATGRYINSNNIIYYYYPLIFLTSSYTQVKPGKMWI